MGKNPPYMGARYGAAHDLSEILENQIRPGQFRSFIPYTLVCEASKMCLETASMAVGAPLWQFSPNGKDAQSFRFEDAGDGFVYIRTLAGLYVTVNEPSGVPTGPGGTLAIKQDLKYAVGSGGPKSSDLQRWKLASSAVAAVNQTSYTISCAAFPGKVLQPANGSPVSGVAVVLADLAPTHSPVIIPNPWKVTSPLLPPPGIVSV